MSASKLPTINLIPKDPFFTSPIGKTLQWALSVGRYIVIFTELIVIISFVSRFTIDRRITDLNESLFQKQNIVESYGNLERDFRAIQQAIQTYSQVSPTQNITDVFPELVRATPPDILLNSLVISNQAIILSGQAPNNTVLQRFIQNLQLLPITQSVVINNIESEQDNQDASQPFVFDLEIVTNTPS